MYYIRQYMSNFEKSKWKTRKIKLAGATMYEVYLRNAKKQEISACVCGVYGNARTIAAMLTALFPMPKEDKLCIE